jgi:hypothetical protein
MQICHIQRERIDMKLDYLSQKKAFVVVCEKDDEQDVVKQIVYNRKNVYYVNNKKIFGFPYKYFKPLKMIHRAIKMNKNIHSIDEILKLLQFDEEVKERLERPWKYQGNYKWFFSVAYGIANGEKIFVMPWMHKGVLDYQEYRNNLICQAISKIQGTILFVVQEIPKDSFLNSQAVIRIKPTK